ncbi:unnamed protein product [Symbiodinium sp. CCMP2592]|nr:unnamed protein product [Symbiodinium sp. CCMP2592]
MVSKAMSYSKSQKLAKAFANDGVKRRDLLQMASSAQERDAYKWMRLPFDPVKVQLPVFSTTAEREDKQTRVRSIWYVTLFFYKLRLPTTFTMSNTAPFHLLLRLVTTPASIVLPSDVLAELSKRGLLSSCLEGFGSVREWWDREIDPVYKGLIDHSDYPYPLLFHEDGVPTTKRETVVFWSWCSALTNQRSEISRFCIIGVPQSRIAKQTRTFIARIISWDLKSLKEGYFPMHDWDGNEWPKMSTRQRRAGKRCPVKAVFAFWKGDQEAHMKSHELCRNYTRKYICDRCLACNSDVILNSGDLSATAGWRQTEEHTRPAPHANDVSPWKQVEGYTRRRRLYDGEMSRFLDLQDQSPKPNEILYRFTSRAQAWCKERRLDLGINPITMDSLNATLKYPELSSTIKASRCRNLLAFVTHFAVELEKQLDPDDCSSETAHWRRARACMLWSLDAALSVAGTAHKPHMTDGETEESVWLFETFLLLYQYAAARAYGLSQLLYKMRPKHHYASHMIAEVAQTKLNFMHCSNFGDEDHMKYMKKIGCLLITLVCPCLNLFVVVRTLFGHAAVQSIS